MDSGWSGAIPVRAPRAGAAEVALVGFQDQGNLGLGYLAAVLRRHGCAIEMIEVRDNPEAIAARLLQQQPLVVGFSLIFQFFLPQYRRIARHLRAAGIRCHFTIGGHYPSLCHDELLTNFPEIDSVVRYEGEETLIELVDRLRAGADWRDISGIAYARDGEVVATPPRPLVEDLDALPFPDRPYEPERVGGFPTLPVLASRGCIRRCSFCSIHTFYRTAPGKVVRVRRPEKVVEEMLELHRRHGVRVFLFQDDDFPLWGRKGRRWADELMARMHDSGLADNTIWKISCRAEYVEPELFAAMREAGLFLVYMGIESGVETGLDILFKQMTVEQNLSAVATLKQLDIVYSYGFMLFDPSSTFESVRQNIGFLRRIVGDGSAPAVFSRMLPYGGTPIRDQLAREGRLRGDLTHPDYDFIDLRLNEYYRRLSDTVRPWIHNQGLSNQLSYAWDEIETFERLTPGLRGAKAYRRALARLTAHVNERLFRLVEESSLAFEQGDRSLLDPEGVAAYCERTRAKLVDLRNMFVANNLEPLNARINADCSTGPVLRPQIH
ncbi:B12-binding domain-containing radical SAM protein [Bradyrhizobium sp.]|uniref:B12-binding domain-containing radical SAM protein n=1 Tax=Bradyrhizobium sp. TaxID=376 RepID=UPI003C1FF28F